MFTGIVECQAEVSEVLREDPAKRLVISADQIAAESRIGDSIAVNGCCLTVVDLTDQAFSVQAGAETLRRTNLGEIRPGSYVNLERSLRLTDRLGGHFVTGHIDGVGVVDARVDEGDWSDFSFRTDSDLLRQIAVKGSIAVDGVSLTVVSVDGDSFRVAMIPHTLKVTRLGRLAPGASVNLETDLLAKYVARLLETEPSE